MKKIIALCLVLAMLFAFSACGCDHVAGDRKLVGIDTTNLTAKWEVPCTQCGKVIETQDASTGVAPENGTMRLNPADWFECLTTNIKNYDASGMLVPMSVESEDGALLRSIVTPNGFKSVFSFFDAQEGVVTTEQETEADRVHRIRIEAQFDNSSASSFYTLLALVAMTNNSDWTTESINALATQVMSGETVTDNGYSYTMEILSTLDHTVAVYIVAE